MNRMRALDLLRIAKQLTRMAYYEVADDSDNKLPDAIWDADAEIESALIIVEAAHLDTRNVE